MQKTRLSNGSKRKRKKYTQSINIILKSSPKRRGIFPQIQTLKISEASLFRLLDTMKKLNAPLKYDNYRQSYIYEKEVSCEFGFNVTELSKDIVRKIEGGGQKIINQVYFFFATSKNESGVTDI